MTGTTLQIPEPVRLRALSEGPVGEAWLARLNDIVMDLATEWHLSIGRTLPGGTEAFVAEVRTADGRGAVLKIGPPGHDPDASELRTLLAAGGRGYAKVYDYDLARGAMLLERLGGELGGLGWPVDTQIEVICTTLMDAWTPLPEAAAFTTGAEKANGLAAFIETTWLELGRPCHERTIEQALRYADIRRRAFEPELAVLAHGDAHPWNTLLVPDSQAREFKFVDPDGLFIERAYDLGVLMREWTSELLVGDPPTLGASRCRQLSELTGVDLEPIWQWGFMETVSTGLLCTKIGLDGARELLAVAETWTGPMPK